MSDIENQVVVTRNGVGLGGFLFLLFLGLKLTGFITWSWWWVTAPLWAPLVAGILLLIGIFLCTALVVGLHSWANKDRR